MAHFAKYRGERVDAVARATIDVANELGCSPAQLAIAWLRHRSPLHIPIIGARTALHVTDNLAAVDVTIPAEFMQSLDETSSIELGFPLDFYREGRAGWFAEHLDRLDPRARPLGRRVMGLDEIARRPRTSG